MRRLMKRLIVIGSVTGLLMALNVGVALAAHDDPSTSPAFGETAGAAPSPSPVGSHLILPGEESGSANGAINGFGFEFGVGPDPTNPAFIAIANNPNCPFHYPET